MRLIDRIQFRLALLAFLAIPHVLLAQRPAVTDKPAPPVAAKKARTTKIHGDTLVDNYYWLREKSNPDVLAHLEAENAYTAVMMKGTEALQEALYPEMLGHIKQTDVNVPYRIGDYYYYSRTEEGKQYPIQARKRGSLEGPEEITLDLNELAKGLKFLSLGSYQVSDDGNLLAYATDTTGYRQYTLFIKDLRTGRLLPEKVERVDAVMWSTDDKTIFYVTEDPVTKRSDRFFRHVLGSDKTDLVYEDPDELYDVSAYRTRDKAFIVVGSESKLTTEERVIPAGSPNEARVIASRQINHKYFVDHRGNLFYILTNDHAKNYRLMTAPDSDPAKKNWKEIIAHRPAIKLDDVNLFADYMEVTELEGGSQTMRVVDLRNDRSTSATTGRPPSASRSRSIRPSPVTTPSSTRRSSDTAISRW